MESDTMIVHRFFSFFFPSMSDFKIKVCMSLAKKLGGVNLQQILSAPMRWGTHLKL